MSDQSHSEIYYSGENNRIMYDSRSEEAEDIFNQVLRVFPWVSLDDSFAVSSSLEHEVLGEPVISFTLSSEVTNALVGAEYTFVGGSSSAGGTFPYSNETINLSSAAVIVGDGTRYG